MNYDLDAENLPSQTAGSPRPIDWHDLASRALRSARQLARGRISAHEQEDVASDSLRALIAKHHEGCVSDYSGYLYGIVRNKMNAILKAQGQSVQTEVNDSTLASTPDQHRAAWAVFLMRRRFLATGDQVCLQYFDALRATNSLREAAEMLGIADTAFRKRHERCRRKVIAWFESSGLADLILAG